MSKTFTLNWTDVKSALITVILGALVVLLIEIIDANNIYALDWKTIINDAVIALLMGLVSIIQSLLTNSKGVIAGIKVK